ncbi:MAG TPA: non-heme iron oxygenase ferredoxin subunit [Myxococcota bacterium]|nr:non-heme iron oxygenase ferredoxin subunit [Myxococcota bacterium]
MNWRRVASLAELPPGSVRRVVVEGIAIALCNVGGELYAVDDQCTHAFASLSEGTLSGDSLECPLHGGRFDVRSGAALGGVVSEDLRRFAVRREGDAVYVALGDA